MTDLRDKTLVVVSDGGSNKLFVGWTMHDHGEFRQMVANGDIMHIHDARILREVTMPTPKGLSITVQVIPYAACLGSCELEIIVTHYFFPNEADDKKLRELIGSCEQSEVVDRAHRGGIATPDGMRVGSSGRMTD